MPAKSGTADHSDRRTNNDRTTGRNHDRASVEVATTIRATMFATAATLRGLGTEAREAQQGGECQNRKNLSAHLRVSSYLRSTAALNVISLPSVLISR
jgi:hypothetical protein